MKKVELLAPAGGIEQFIAAVENGADAIYIGGTLYNARMNAANFTMPEMKQAIDYGHLRGVKTYVTMNTLMLDSELKPALNYAKKLYEMGVDALIIQDIGFGKLVKEALPNFAIHLSTQATVYNKEGVIAAKELGYERVVLARETTLDEIAECTKCGVAIETFVHGALCYCYSGQCQLSRAIGGRSGNRGACAQPCRLTYTGGESGYPLSPKDLCLIDNLGELIDSGVYSFKIEGRMKSKEYVGTVTRIYRKYIDRYLKYGKYEVSEQDRFDLAQAFNRGGFTGGYLHEDPEEALLSGLIPKNQGIKVGEVIRAKKGGLLAEIRLDRIAGIPQASLLEMGDVVEVHANPAFTTKVTYIEELGKGRLVIGDMKGAVREGDAIHRIVSEALTKSVKYTLDKPTRKSRLDMLLVLKVDAEPVLSATCYALDEKVKAECKLDGFKVQEARERGTSDEDLEAQLRKSGNTPFEVANVKIIKNAEVFMPLSKINELRRLCLEKMAACVLKETEREVEPETFTRVLETLEDEGAEKARPKACEKCNKADKNCNACVVQKLDFGEDNARFEHYFYSFEDFEEAFNQNMLDKAKNGGYDRGNVKFLLPIISFVENMRILQGFTEKYGASFVPYINNVVKGKADCEICGLLTNYAEQIKAFTDEIYVGNISHIEVVRKLGFRALSDFGLNIYNKESARAYARMGADSGVWSLEALDESVGGFPLMITEHEMSDGVLTDRVGKKYKVSFDRNLHKTFIRAKLSAPSPENAMMSGPGVVRIYY